MEKILSLLVFLLLVSSCSTKKYLKYKDTMPQPLLQYTPNEWDIYIFQMKNIKEKRNICGRKDNVEVIRYVNGIDEEGELIYEEIYLFKHKTEPIVLYFTSTSNKYISENENFNNQHYDKSFFINDIDYVMFGRITNDKILFANSAMTSPNTKEPIIIQYIENKEEDIIEFISITNDHPWKCKRIKRTNKEKIKINERQVLMDSIFGIKLKFKKTSRTLSFKNESKEIDSISDIYMSGNNIYFSSKNEFKYKGNWKYAYLKNRYLY